jgi:hypothetical protein
VVLEEYADSKRRLGQIGIKTYTGRVDLYFEVGIQKFVAESKHVWVAATNRKSQHTKIQDCMKHATRDINQSKRDIRFRRLAIVFAAPYIAVKGKSPLTGRALKELKDSTLWSIEQAKMTNYDAMAWTFPGLGRYGEYTGGVTRKIFPGVIMLVKEVGRPQ